MSSQSQPVSTPKSAGHEGGDMVERVARAMAGAETALVDLTWRRYVPAARAAIEAMREPTEAMYAGLGGECLKWAPGAWDAMISSALGERP